MFLRRGVMGWGSNYEQRFIPDYDRLASLVNRFRQEDGYRIGLTSGTFDILHIGHMIYLERARELCDVLIIGVDSDEKVRARKGPDRPLVQQEERLMSLTHLRSVTIVTLKELNHPRRHLIKTVKPDVLIISERTTYSQEDREQLGEFCGDITLLPPQAEASTTGRIRSMEITGGSKLADKITEQIPEAVNGLSEEVSRILVGKVQQVIPELVARSLRELREGM